MFGFNLTLNSLSQRACCLFLTAPTLPFLDTHTCTNSGHKRSSSSTFLLPVDKKTLLHSKDGLYPWRKKHVGFSRCWTSLGISTWQLVQPLWLKLLVWWTRVISGNWWLPMAQTGTWATCRYTLILWLPPSFLAMTTTQHCFLSCCLFSSINQALKLQQTAKAISP